MRDVVPTILGTRVGIVQDGGWLKVRSVCCGGKLRQTDEPESDTFDFYECNTCGLEGGVVNDFSGHPLATKIGVAASTSRLEEWVSCWLQEADVSVQVTY